MRQDRHPGVPLSPVLTRYDHVLLDLDGCVWVGDDATPRAVEAVDALREAGRGIAFVTNDARHTGEELVRKLWRLGLRAALEEIVTVGGALQHVLNEHHAGQSAFVIGAPAVIVQAFLSLKRGGKAIVVGVPPFGSEVPIPGFSIPLEEKSVIGSLYGSANMRRDMPKLIDLYMRGRLKIDELVSRRIKLDDVNAAFEAMEKGEVARSVIVY